MLESQILDQILRETYKAHRAIEEKFGLVEELAAWRY